MKLDFNGMLYALSYALDCEEKELLGVAEEHAKWVAFISAVMGKNLGYDNQKLTDLAACAALHDNALTQYIAEEKQDAANGLIHFGTHCSIGEKNVEQFPFYTDMTGAILYHHENADGSGLFHKKTEETPIAAQIIHLADYLDATCQLKNISEEKYERISHILRQHENIFFSSEMVQLFFQALPKETYLSLQGNSIYVLLHQAIPKELRDCSFAQIQEVLKVFAKIIDYKSTFTRNHSVQIGQKAYRMGEYYGYSQETKERLYVAGILHDIGKMAIDNDILEKPDKLTNQEFTYMQNHAWYTYEILSQIEGFTDITSWASLHHEKLNGKGYPFGKTAAQLGEKERLMACIDIYQALREDRPYKQGLPHEACISIMQDMVAGGFIDGNITADIDFVFSSEQS